MPASASVRAALIYGPLRALATLSGEKCGLENAKGKIQNSKVKIQKRLLRVRVVFFGATKGMGRALARLMAARGDALFLLGRDLDDLSRSARDLEVTGASGAVGTGHCDLLRPETFVPALDQAAAALGGIDAVVVTAGLFATQEELERDAELRQRLLVADFVNTVQFCEEARRRLLDGSGGTLCVFSSVAGERGRKPVVLYGAAKAGLSRYLEGLDHKFRAQGLKTIAVKPGFVKTGMTAGLTPPPFAGEPDDVARLVLKSIDRGRPEVYAPSIWRWIMLVIRLLPRFVMRRIGF
jgi:decaprenylphospho-beta-D-erythro-pentofuranosid-2-ulose 2-reductase